LKDVRDRSTEIRVFRVFRKFSKTSKISSRDRSEWWLAGSDVESSGGVARVSNEVKALVLGPRRSGRERKRKSEREYVAVISADLDA
jgi:hypothetical protein